jgi:hypothetical protein
MRHLLNFVFALVLALGTGGVELRVEGHPEPCGCCETTTPTEPCGCGMPQPSSRRCGDRQTPTTALVRPVAPPSEFRSASRIRTEAEPCPTQLTTRVIGSRLRARPASRTFNPGEGPPLSSPERLAQLSLYRI